MTRPGSHTAALALALAWMALAFVLASAAAEWGLVASRQAAMVQWLLAGVLPAAAALASLEPEDRRRLGRRRGAS